MNWKVVIGLAIALVLCCCSSMIVWFYAFIRKDNNTEENKVETPPQTTAPETPSPASDIAAVSIHAQEGPVYENKDPGSIAPFSQSGSTDALVPRACQGTTKETRFRFENMMMPRHRPDVDGFMDDKSPHTGYVFETGTCKHPSAVAVRNVASGKYLTNLGDGSVGFTSFSDPHSAWIAINIACPGAEHVHLASVSQPTKFLYHDNRKLALGVNFMNGRAFCWGR